MPTVYSPYGYYALPNRHKKQPTYQPLGERTQTFKTEVIPAQHKKKHHFAQFMPRFHKDFNTDCHDYDQSEKACAGYRLGSADHKKTDLFVKPVFDGPVCAIDGNMAGKPTHAYMNNDFAQPGQRGDVFSTRSKKKLGEGSFTNDDKGHLAFTVTAAKVSQNTDKLFATKAAAKQPKSLYVMPRQNAKRAR